MRCNGVNQPYSFQSFIIIPPRTRFTTTFCFSLHPSSLTISIGKVSPMDFPPSLVNFLTLLSPTDFFNICVTSYVTYYIHSITDTTPLQSTLIAKKPAFRGFHGRSSNLSLRLPIHPNDFHEGGDDKYGIENKEDEEYEILPGVERAASRGII